MGVTTQEVRVQVDLYGRLQDFRVNAWHHDIVQKLIDTGSADPDIPIFFASYWKAFLEGTDSLRVLEVQERIKTEKSAAVFRILARDNPEAWAHLVTHLSIPDRKAAIAAGLDSSLVPMGTN